MNARGEGTDVMIGAAVVGVRAGGEPVRVAIACGRFATRVPVLGGPLRTAVGRVAADGDPAPRPVARLLHLPFFAGFRPVLFDDRRRGLHDMVAGTVVVHALDDDPRIA